MRGLLLKDILVITKQLKLFLIVIPVMAIIGSGSMATLAVVMGAALPMTSIACDERSKWNELAVMMPYSEKELVISKYLFGYLCMLGAVALIIVVRLIMVLIGIGNFFESVNVLLLSVVSGLVLIAINMPILFKFGSEKGRIVFIIAIAIAGGLGPVLKGFDSNVILEMMDVLPVLLLVGAIILNVISIYISVHIKIK